MTTGAGGQLGEPAWHCPHRALPGRCPALPPSPAQPEHLQDPWGHWLPSCRTRCSAGMCWPQTPQTPHLVVWPCSEGPAATGCPRGRPEHPKISLHLGGEGSTEGLEQSPPTPPGRDDSGQSTDGQLAPLQFPREQPRARPGFPRSVRWCTSGGPGPWGLLQSPVHAPHAHARSLRPPPPAAGRALS